MKIPKIIHQTWKTHDVPKRWITFVESWKRNHPDWAYRLWTDSDNRSFLEEHFPWFVPIYDYYPEDIMRTDAVRYFILHHFGGIYADLDYQCLRPFDSLVADMPILLGLEPESHLQQEVVRDRGFNKLVSNALMASAPGHPFWPHVFRKLVESRDASGPLDAAGSFLLTRAFESFSQPDTITLAPAHVLFPIVKEATVLTGDEVGQQSSPSTAHSYGIHHWHGSRIVPPRPPTLRMRVGRLALRGRDAIRLGQHRFWTAGNGFFRKRQETAKAWAGLIMPRLDIRRPVTITVSTSIWQRLTPELPPIPRRPPDPARRLSTTAPPRQALPHYPTVLILCPVKDAVPFLPRFWHNLRTLSYPHHKLTLAFLESDSEDGTFEFIQAQLPSLRADFARVQVFKQDYGYETPEPRWLPSAQLQRRSIIAKSRNQMLARALRDEDWVLWIDVDVMQWPSDVIEQMLATGKDIITPNCLNPDGETFDYNTWKLSPEAAEIDWSPRVSSGIWLAPFGEGRRYLQELRHYDLVEIDSVGGTMLLVRADLHREGLIFPPFPYKYLIETEGLAAMARDMGYACWGMPNLEIIHS